MKVKIINNSPNPLPQYATAGSAGMDIYTNVSEPFVIDSLERVIVPTGLFIELPKGYEAQIRSRSGLTAQRGICVANAPGTIDSDYRGEIKVILINLSNKKQTVGAGERIAQMVVAKHERVTWEAVADLEESQRGEGGFGSTGTK